ncbi:MAG: hypothetical protein D6675_15190 [Gemmatimonadetes bacterium]|nr:MAG: hypothetical protein D6675_15190 [Gemmatimonadota bacterium]
MNIIEHVNHQIQADTGQCWNIRHIPSEILNEMRKSQDTQMWFVHEGQRVRAFDGYFTEFSLVVYPYMDFVDLKACGLHRGGIDLQLIQKMDALQQPVTPEILELFHRQRQDWMDK